MQVLVIFLNLVERVDRLFNRFVGQCLIHFLDGFRKPKANQNAIVLLLSFDIVSGRALPRVVQPIGVCVVLGPRGVTWGGVETSPGNLGKIGIEGFWTEVPLNHISKPLPAQQANGIC